MFLWDKLKEVFRWLVVHRICFGKRIVLCFQFGFVAVVPPIVKYICREVSVQLRCVPNGTATVVNKGNSINPSTVITPYNRINALLNKLLFKFRFAVCGVYRKLYRVFQNRPCRVVFHFLFGLFKVLLQLYNPCIFSEYRCFERIGCLVSVFVQCYINQSVYRLTIPLALNFFCRNIKKRKQGVVCSKTCVLIIFRQMPYYRSDLTFNISFLLFYFFENLISLFLFLLGGFMQVVFLLQISTDSH